MSINGSINSLGNVLDEKDTTLLIQEVISYVANSVKQTFGPYGHNALIQTMDNVYSTKDGWTVLQNITFKHPLYNAIKSMIANVAQSTVLLVGDGSTTSTIAADCMNRFVTKCKNEFTIRELENSLTKCVDKIIYQLRLNAKAITEENMEEAIYKIALVSTNWNEELANIIKDIYLTTHNPIIKIEDSGTDKTFVEYIEGYELAGSLMGKDFYITDHERGLCKLEEPLVMIFNHGIQEKLFLSLTCLGEVIRPLGKTLVVIAPSIENAFMTKLNTTNMVCLNQRKPVMNVVPIKVPDYYSVDHDCINDFAALTNSKIITATDDDFQSFMDDLSSTMMKSVEGLDEAEMKSVNMEKQIMAKTAIEYVTTNLCGSCEELTAGDKSLVIKGLNMANKDVIEERKVSIQCEIDKKTREYDALTMLTDDIRMKRIRLGKLQCNMGIIKVGGYGSANIKAKKDALDDATRACEAAYRDGYTIGGSMAILNAISDLTKKNEDVDFDSSTCESDNEIMHYIFDSFVYVFRSLLDNKYDDNTDFNEIAKLDGNEFVNALFNDERKYVVYNDGETTSMNINDIILKCQELKVTFNVMDNSFDVDNNVINPVNVDIESLKACMRLVIASITSNQLIYRHYDLNSNVDDIIMKEV